MFIWLSNEGFDRSSGRDPPLLIIVICHPKHIPSIIRILIPQFLRISPLKNPLKKRGFYVTNGWEWGILFSPFHSEKRLVTQYAILGILLPTHSSSVSLRFRIPSISYLYIFKSPSFRRGIFENIWLGMRDSNPRCRIQSPEPYHLANSQYKKIRVWGGIIDIGFFRIGATSLGNSQYARRIVSKGYIFANLFFITLCFL